jgi:hypothetical protein
MEDFSWPDPSATSRQRPIQKLRKSADEIFLLKSTSRQTSPKTKKNISSFLKNFPEEIS